MSSSLKNPLEIRSFQNHLKMKVFKERNRGGPKKHRSTRMKIKGTCKMKKREIRGRSMHKIYIGYGTNDEDNILKPWTYKQEKYQ
jgi:hypothetical protein